MHPRLRRLILAGLAASACRPEGECARPADLPERPRLAVSLSDFQSGALALHGDEGLSPEIFPTTGDAIVRAGPSGLYVIERGASDVITAFDPEDPGCPRWQVALPRGTNAHDLLERDGVLWVPAYDRPVLHALSAVDGSPVAELDLGSQAESEDGLPELDRVFASDGRLWVVAQRLRRTGSAWEADIGRLLEIDPVGPALIGAHDLGPNPRARAVDERTLAVATGLFARGPNDPFAPERLRDGGLYMFDLTSQMLSPPLATEEALGGDLGAVVPHPGGMVLLVVDADASTSVICRSEAGDVSGPSGSAWIVDGAWDGAGLWLAARRGLADGALTEAGLLPLDAASCAAGPRVDTPLEPFDLAPLD